MSRVKILIVEDDSDVRRLYAIALNQRGFQVRLASNGAEAVERIAMEAPDVILLDWVMPLMSGQELLERVLVNGSASIPVIVISGRPKPQHVDDRVRRWLPKPVAIDDLIGEIERCVPSAANGGVR